MSVGLYMDHHVPAAITRGLRRCDVDVLTAEEDGAADWDDERLLERATHLGRIIFTQDDDLLAIGRQWQNSGREFAGIVYAHQLRITIGQAIRDFGADSEDHGYRRGYKPDRILADSLKIGATLLDCIAIAVTPVSLCETTSDSGRMLLVA